MPVSNRVHFKMMSLVHETLYGLFRDPYSALQAAGLQEGQAVLEVGCGPGFFTVPAARIVGQKGRVYTLDIDPLAVEHVRAKVEQAGVGNVDVVLADAAHTGLSERSFDLAFVFGLARPIGGAREIFAELHRLLKPEGVLAIEGRLRPPGELFQPVARRNRIARFKKIG